MIRKVISIQKFCCSDGIFKETTEEEEKWAIL